MNQYAASKPKNFQVFFECPDQFAKAKALGAVGSIDGLANLIPHEATKAMNGCKQSIEKYATVRKVLATSNNYIGLLRFGLEQLGMNPGPCFAPNTFVRASEKEALLQSLDAIGRLQLI